MENKFLKGMAQEENWTKTENGADALKSTENDLIDLFGTIGALRKRSDEDITVAFMKAYNANKLLALKMLFYARNIRGGLGERRVFRVILKWMVETDPENVTVNLSNIAKFGRYDDFYVLVGTRLEKEAFEFLHKQFVEDVANATANKPVSLLGKWLKSANSHSRETRALGLKTAKAFGLTEVQYRKMLTLLRKAIKVTEVAMSAKEWGSIAYDKVPALAMTKYHDAFNKHDKERFEEYLDSLKKGTAKINAATLYPYNLVEDYMYRSRSSLDETIEAQWKALPNYVEGENNFMVMADVSGSMSGRPMATSVGLAIYFAERNHGPYHNKFMTFSSNPTFITIKGKTLRDRVSEVMRADWGMSTNIEAAFDRILTVAINNKLRQEDLPKSLIIISDMEFNQCTGPTRNTFYAHMTAKFEAAGYKLPKVVFWNVNARNDVFHARVEPGVQFISGQATSAFKSLITGAELSAFDLMLETLNDPMYDSVVLAKE